MENKENPNQRLEVDETQKTQMADELNEALNDAKDVQENVENKTTTIKKVVENSIEEAKEKIENSNLVNKASDTLETTKERADEALAAAKMKAAEALEQAGDVSDKMKVKLAGAWEQVEDKWEEVEETELWNKITRHAKKAGVKVVYSALLLWYAYQRNETPRWAKRIILGAVAYFLSPIDLIPDLAPFLGFTDDFGILGMGLIAIARYINDDVRTKAREQLGNWFTDYDEVDLKDVDEKI